MITVEFEVTGVSVDKCGSYGGCPVVISGRGFNTDCSKNNIKFGSVSCNPTSCTETSVECKLAYASTVHKVTNDGTHPKFGDKFAWSPRSIDIMAGDIITWVWTPPQFVRNLKYKVAETDTQTDTETKAGGFESSSIGSLSGSYRRHFPNTGTHHYFSGYVDDLQTISFRGLVNVGTRNPFVSYLKFMQMSTEATYTLSMG